MPLHDLKKIRFATIHTVIFSVLLAMTAYAASPGFRDVKFSDRRDGNSPKEVFASDTPKIFLHAQLVEIDNGTKLTATWIAENTEGAPADFKIESTDLTASESMKDATFALSKPNAGWPEGNYRVELAINTKAAGLLHFKVVK